MKKFIFLLLILLTIIISGCTTYQEISNPVYFDDTNDTIMNYKVCNELGTNACKSRETINKKCITFKITYLVCDKGRCICD